LIESELEVIQKQLSRLLMCRELGRTARGIIIATMMLTTLSFAVVPAVIDRSNLTLMPAPGVGSGRTTMTILIF
jgi:hypothetical protein